MDFTGCFSSRLSSRCFDDFRQDVLIDMLLTAVAGMFIDGFRQKVNGFYGMFLMAFVRMFLTVFVILLTAFD